MSTPPPRGSTRTTSAPRLASVAPPSGAATKADSSTIRSPSSTRSTTDQRKADTQLSFAGSRPVIWFGRRMNERLETGRLILHRLEADDFDAWLQGNRILLEN